MHSVIPSLKSHIFLKSPRVLTAYLPLHCLEGMVTTQSEEKPKVRGEFYIGLHEHLMILTTQCVM